jgi:murein DD-endopeptidase MepM/ murein hydrolase activator NlpD
MDGIFSARRYRRSVSSNKTLASTVFKQAAVCVIIFAVLFALKSINTPATNFLSGKIKYVLAMDYDLNSFLNLFGGGQGLPAENGETEADGALEPGQDTETGTGLTAVEGTWMEKGESRLEEGGGYDFIAPVNGVLLSKFGEGTDPVEGMPAFNEGIDILTLNGENVRAVLDGTVSDTGTSAVYGKFLKIEHDGGLYTLYANCSELFLSKGQRAIQGDIIGKVGNSAGGQPFLHFEIHRNGNAIDPLQYISVSLQ